MENTTAPGKRTSPLLIVAAWLIVIIPAAWGLRYTVGNALKLFSAPAVPASSPAPSAHERSLPGRPT